MRKILVFLLVPLLAFALMVSQAEARRLGGSKSFGYQRSAPTYNYSRPAPAAQPAPVQQIPQSQPSRASRWLGPLAGFAGGLALGSLFGHGFFGGGGGFGGLLMLLLVIGGIWFLLNLFRRPNNPETFEAEPMQPITGDSRQYEPVPAAGQSSWLQPGNTAAQPRPAGWSDDIFLREAKSEFIRMQAAFDARDLSDIRQYTTPEVFAEISLQVQEMGSEANFTEVLQIDAEMLDVFTENEMLIASVRFHGMIREGRNEAAHPFAETWHFARPANQPDAVFRIAGIQQD